MNTGTDCVHMWLNIIVFDITVHTHIVFSCTIEFKENFIYWNVFYHNWLIDYRIVLCLCYQDTNLFHASVMNSWWDIMLLTHYLHICTMCTACEYVMAGYAIYDLLAECSERFNLPCIRGSCCVYFKLAVNLHKTTVLCCAAHLYCNCTYYAGQRSSLHFCSRKHCRAKYIVCLCTWHCTMHFVDGICSSAIIHLVEFYLSYPYDIKPGVLGRNSWWVSYVLYCAT